MGWQNRVAVYSIVRGKLDLTRKSLKSLRQWAGMDFDLFVCHNDDDRPMAKYLRSEQEKGHIKWLLQPKKNLGQNIAANFLLDQIALEEYTHIMRWDPDGVPRTRRFLKKLVSCHNRMRDNGAVTVMSPTITQLKYPPQAVAWGDDLGFKYDVVPILGGICRLHPPEFFDGWRFNKFGALGFGEAAEVADRAEELGTPRVRLHHLEVEHCYGEDGQAERWPEQFGWAKEVSRYVGYGV